MDAERAAWVAERFRLFAQAECGESPLYGALAEGVAGDRELVEVAAEAPAGQPVPNLFLGAVHYLVLKGEGGGLRRYYPSVGGMEALRAEGWGEFRRLVMARRGEIVGIMKGRRVQTNEVLRCAMLLPALGVVAGMEGGRPLYLIEVGTSAGLLLLLDRYAYRYSDGQEAGTGEVRLACEVRGERRVPVPAGEMPRVAGRVGVDLEPVDVGDEGAALWLRALVWPDQRERAERLRRAIEVARRERVRLVRGEANEVLPGLIEEAPAGVAVCVVHCYTLNQFSAEGRRRFREVLADASRERGVYEVGVEGFQQDSRVTLGRYGGGGVEKVWHLADNHAHGRWIRWVGEEVGGRRGS